MGNHTSSPQSDETIQEPSPSRFGRRGVKLGKRTHVGFASTRGRSGAYKAPVKVFKSAKGGAKLYVLKKGKLQKLAKNRMMVRKTTKAARNALNAKRVAKNKALKKKSARKTKKSVRKPSKNKLRSRGRTYNQCTLQKRKAACTGQTMPDGSARCKWRKAGSKPRCVLGKGNAPAAPPKMPGMAPWMASASRSPAGVSAKALSSAKLAKGIPAPPALPGAAGRVKGSPTEQEKSLDNLRRIIAANERVSANPWAGRFGARRPIGFGARRPIGFGARRPIGFGAYPRRF